MIFSGRGSWVMRQWLCFHLWRATSSALDHLHIQGILGMKPLVLARLLDPAKLPGSSSFRNISFESLLRQGVDGHRGRTERRGGQSPGIQTRTRGHSRYVISRWALSGIREAGDRRKESQWKDDISPTRCICRGL